jgi:hypothetical protein
MKLHGLVVDELNLDLLPIQVRTADIVNAVIDGYALGDHR